MKVSAFKYEIETVGLLYLVRHVFAMDSSGLSSLSSEAKV